ncbi:DUF1996 domain-containing protein [Planosporangium sp. 12N6]|uniref:DUF1996 domain-containing protein n=1 Tax=Planosporangium spinosum TaxID=3402278 RepID=UPI003CEC1E2A
MARRAAIRARSKRKRFLGIAMGVVLAAGFAAGIRAAVATESDDPDILAIMAQLPNDQAPGVCDVPKATASAGTRPATASPSTSAGQATSTSAPSAAPSASAGAACPHGDQGGPFASDFVSINDVPAKVRDASPGRDASRGTFVSVCGRNENNHYNSDNFIVAPGVTNGAHHIHDYVGNVSTDGFSTDGSLAAAGTTCKGNDQSAYFWPVLRTRAKVDTDQKTDPSHKSDTDHKAGADQPGGSADGNIGTILRPASVRLEFRGNAKTKVRAMPRFLRVITGDAKAGTNGPTNARAAWTCTGFDNRLTTRYPVCPQGSQVQRILDFPSCWDGKNTDSPNHRSHIVFPKNDGSCWEKTVAVPQLRMVLTYDVPARSVISLDTFPEQKHNPLTDHADFINLMPDALMKSAVHCINTAHECDADGALGAEPSPSQVASATASATRSAPQQPAASTGAAGHSHTSAPRTQTPAPPAAPGQQIQQAPPAVRADRTAAAGTGQPAAPSAGAAAPSAAAAPGATAAPDTAPAAGAENPAASAPGGDTQQQQPAEPPLPATADGAGTTDGAGAAPGAAPGATEVAGVAGAPGAIPGLAGATGAPGTPPPGVDRAAGQEGLLTGTNRIALYILNGTLLAALIGWIGMMVRRRRLR